MSMSTSARVAPARQTPPVQSGDELPATAPGLRLAVLVPCLNEAGAIGEVVRSFRTALPTADVYVFDNGSADGTVAEAEAEGAIVRHERQRGKGNVMRRMFADIDADVYVMVDGDNTYDATDAPAMIRTLLQGPFDLVNGAREAVDSASAYRQGHQFGNRLLTGLVSIIFGQQIGDMLSGYKVISRRFVKSFPALSTGFEIETEIAIHALELRMAITELKTRYRERSVGTASKLKTYADGFRILKTIIVLLKEERPLQFFSAVAGILAIASLILVFPVLLTYFETGLVPRLPTAILAMGLMVLSSLSLTSGLILDTVTRGRREQKRISYLGIPAPRSATGE